MTDRDRARLGASDQRLIDKVGRVIDAMARQGFVLIVTDGVRTQGRQMALYDQGRRLPGKIVTYADGVNKKSQHQLGRAADCTFLVHGQPSWAEDLPWGLYGEAAEAEDLIWGGRWKTPDRPHVELKPDPIPEGTLVA